MKRKYKFFNGDIVEYETNEEYEALAEKNWELMKKQWDEEEKKMKNTIEKIKIYVDTDLREKYPNNEIGLVYTKLEEDIERYGAFMIWIDKGYTINHKFIYLKDVELNY